MSREINITLKLDGWFSHIYNHNKPENLTDDRYIQAIVNEWLLGRDEKNPVPKTSRGKCSA